MFDQADHARADCKLFNIKGEGEEREREPLRAGGAKGTFLGGEPNHDAFQCARLHCYRVLLIRVAPLGVKPNNSGDTLAMYFSGGEEGNNFLEILVL